MSEVNFCMNPEGVQLLPCPFCGAVPTLKCDLTDWAGRPVYGPDEKGYRPTWYTMEARHRKDCYIYHMDGTNSTGRMTAGHWECLVEWWQRRYDNG